MLSTFPAVGASAATAGGTARATSEQAATSERAGEAASTAEATAAEREAGQASSTRPSSPANALTITKPSEPSSGTLW